MSEKVAIVTGASRGIGRAACLALARDGYRVVAVSRDESLLRELTEAGPGDSPIHAHVADVRKSDQVIRAVREAGDRFARIDMLVNNAGVAPLSAVDKITDDEFQECLDVNVSATFYATRAVWPIMTRQAQGIIVNISSFASVDPFPGFQVYGASKAWVNLFTKAVADEGRPLGIQVYSLALGTVETDLLRRLFPDFPREKTLSPEDVAGQILQLAHPACRHASGTTLFIRR